MINSPGALFIGALKSEDKQFVKTVLIEARKKGYEHFVEPCAGALAMSVLAREAGYKTEQITASDVSYFSGIVGRYIKGEGIEEMEIEAEGFTQEEMQDHATALFAQLYLKLIKSSGKEYFMQLFQDLRYRREIHIANIRKQLDDVKNRCGPIGYKDLDMWLQFEEAYDDPKAIVVACPPTYNAGYEKFFDTGGKLKWKEPPYGIFDPETGTATLHEMMSDAKCLLLCYEECETGFSAGQAVYGRDAGRPGMAMYITSNRPDEVTELAKGKAIARKNGAKMEPLKMPILPHDYEITEQSVVEVKLIKNENATYYRRLWTHNFIGGAGGCCCAMIIDNHVAGVFGYDKIGMSLGGSTDLTYSFGIGVPHKARVNRLMQRLAMEKRVVYQFLTDVDKLLITGIKTAMITKYPESKEMRGVMKLVSKTKDPKIGYKLVYAGGLTDNGFDSILKEWVKGEEKWKQSRSK